MSSVLNRLTQCFTKDFQTLLQFKLSYELCHNHTAYTCLLLSLIGSFFLLTIIMLFKNIHHIIIECLRVYVCICAWVICSALDGCHWAVRFISLVLWIPALPSGAQPIRGCVAHPLLTSHQACAPAQILTHSPSSFSTLTLTGIEIAFLHTIHANDSIYGFKR